MDLTQKDNQEEGNQNNEKGEGQRMSIWDNPLKDFLPLEMNLPTPVKNSPISKQFLHLPKPVPKMPRLQIKRTTVTEEINFDCNCTK